MSADTEPRALSIPESVALIAAAQHTDLVESVRETLASDPQPLFDADVVRELVEIIDALVEGGENPAAEADDPEPEFIADDLLRDGLFGLVDWDGDGEPDAAPDWLVDAVTAVVQPELVRLAKARDEATRRIANARAEIRRQSAQVHGGPTTFVVDALDAVETHLVAPEYRAATTAAGVAS